MQDIFREENVLRDEEGNLRYVINPGENIVAEDDDDVVIENVSAVSPKVQRERTGRRESRKLMYLNNVPVNERSPYCDHVFDVTRFPRKSCDRCWDFFFTRNAEHTKNLIVAVEGGYWREIKAKHGTEYLKQIERFVAAVREQVMEQGVEEFVEKQPVSLIEEGVSA